MRRCRTTAGFLIVLLIVLAAALTGCGTSAGDETLTKREYIEQANALQQDAATVFEQADGAALATPARAKQQVEALDALIAGFDALRPPAAWRGEHTTIMGSLRSMRQSLVIISRASSRNVAVITRQLKRYTSAQRDYERAVKAINTSR